jgi:hypothetical protein
MEFWLFCRIAKILRSIVGLLIIILLTFCAIKYCHYYSVNSLVSNAKQDSDLMIT